jgi:hypothetical protein
LPCARLLLRAAMELEEGQDEGFPPTVDGDPDGDFLR